MDELVNSDSGAESASMPDILLVRYMVRRKKICDICTSEKNMVATIDPTRLNYVDFGVRSFDPARLDFDDCSVSGMATKYPGLPDGGAATLHKYVCSLRDNHARAGHPNPVPSDSPQLSPRRDSREQLQLLLVPDTTGAREAECGHPC
jgi:hypothetical protein